MGGQGMGMGYSGMVGGCGKGCGKGCGSGIGVGFAGFSIMHTHFLLFRMTVYPMNDQGWMFRKKCLKNVKSFWTYRRRGGFAFTRSSR
jgi:hypothetical protein